MSNFPSTVYRLTKRPAAKAEADEPAPRVLVKVRKAREKEEAHKRRCEEFAARRAARIERIRQQAKAFHVQSDFIRAHKADYSWIYAQHDVDLLDELFGHMHKTAPPLIDLISLCKRVPA